VDFDTLTFADVSRSFGRRRALSRITFSCTAGEIIGVLGPNGSGKSTLLSIAAGVVNPTAGRVLYGNETARTGGAALRATIGLLAHDLFLYPELSAAENLRFFGRLYGLDQIESVVDRALIRAHLVDRRDDLVSGFSRGMRQRLAIERALVHSPRLVLLDEPFTGLDDAAVTALQARLTELRAAGSIVLLTTHDLETIDGVIDRAVMLNAGRLAPFDADGGRLRDRYRRASTTS
jgi:heme ABC exporter ATP-binding subunit CcmA